MGKLSASLDDVPSSAAGLLLLLGTGKTGIPMGRTGEVGDNASGDEQGMTNASMSRATSGGTPSDMTDTDDLSITTPSVSIYSDSSMIHSR